MMHGHSVSGTGTVSRSTSMMRPSESTQISRATLADIMSPEFYEREFWVDELFERLFKIRNRDTTITAEIYFGFVHFISCFYCLAVIPRQLSFAGYDKSSVFVATAACCGVGSIICGLFANLPFVLAPPTVATIFLAVFLKNSSGVKDPTTVGSAGVIISGVALMLMGYRPLGQFIGRMIPYAIQAGTAVGIGLLTALAGAVDIDLIVPGVDNELLKLGAITDQVIITVAGIIIICLASHFHIKGSFCLAIIVCSIIWGIVSRDWPTGIVSLPKTKYFDFGEFNSADLPLLVVDLVFLYILYLNGLIASLSNLANLTREEDGQTPRGRWIFLLTGAMTIISGLLTGAPVLVSPESAAAIKEGAKTGLSTMVCGLLFVVSIFFSPIFEAIPAAGTSPILLMIGVLLFQNVGRVDWRSVKDATPAFIVLFFIPFSYSVIQGVLLGISVFLIVGFFTGDLRDNTAIMLHIYMPKAWLKHLPRDPRQKLADELEQKESLWSDRGSDTGGSLDAPFFSPRSSVDSKNSNSRHSQKDLNARKSKSKSIDQPEDVYMSMGFEHDLLFELKPHMTKVSDLTDVDNPFHPRFERNRSKAEQSSRINEDVSNNAFTAQASPQHTSRVPPIAGVNRTRSNSSPTVPTTQILPSPLLRNSTPDKVYQPPRVNYHETLPSTRECDEESEKKENDDDDDSQVPRFTDAEHDQ